jgi:OFA family oxalate/formate antiporter-like MFS transporter
MGRHWQDAFHVGRGEVGESLFFVLLAVGLLMFLSGRWQECIGPGRLAAMGGILCGGGTILLGFASSMAHVYLWSFLVGASSSFIYIPALTVVQYWYPQRRGLVSGVTNMVFGLSGAFLSPVCGLMMAYWGYSYTCYSLGLLALIVILPLTPFIRIPSGSQLSSLDKAHRIPGPSVSLTVTQSIRQKTFWLLWLIWALGGASGIAMVPLSMSFGLANGLPAQQAVVILSAFNVTNGLSRLVSGYVSDIIGRNLTLALSFLVAGCAYFQMQQFGTILGWSISAACIGFSFGTMFAVSAPLIGECFGMKHFGAIFGLVFTAYGFMAGLLGPWLSGYLLDATNSNFRLVFSYLGAFCVVSAAMAFFVRSGEDTTCP